MNNKINLKIAQPNYAPLSGTSDVFKTQRAQRLYQMI
jgi:hypothetical protein